MIKSMTGFGKALVERSGRKINIEIRSLNSKQLDLSFRIPYIYKEKELDLRSEISKQIERGKVDVVIQLEQVQETIVPTINKTLAKLYHAELKKIAEELDEGNAHLLPLVLRIPEVLKGEKEITELDEEEWSGIKEVLNLAIEKFQKFRMDEGKILEKEFLSRIKIIADLLLEVTSLDALRVNNIKERIRTNLVETIEKDQLDENRFEQELIYYIEKLDITEEKLRLKTHLDYFLVTMKEPSSGRKLGFIAQEIGREINTIGSKANDSTIQKLVVQMKDELEKIKEQLLNVL